MQGGYTAMHVGSTHCPVFLGAHTHARMHTNAHVWRPQMFLFAILHSGLVFWYGFLGLLLYGADVVQRLVLRRRTAAATVTVYPQAAAAAAAAAVVDGGRLPAAGEGGKFVVLRIHTPGPPGCFAGQHVFLRVRQGLGWGGVVETSPK